MNAIGRRQFLTGSTTLCLATMFSSPLAAAISNGLGVDEFYKYDALDLADLIRKKRISSAELVEVAIKRIEKVNPVLNCISVKDYEIARALSRTKLPDGAFSGVPMLLKDLFVSYSGTRTTNGSPIFKSTPASKQDDLLITRMKDAGFVLVGKTNTPEFGWNISTESALHGYTRNPWNLDHTSGGSSGGASAAVAARVLPIAWASDGAGSIRIPASNCGLVGLKSSRGRLPHGPGAVDAMYGASTQGCVSISVRDTAAFIDTLKGSLPGDPYTLPATGSFLDEVKKDPGKLKIGYVLKGNDGQKVDPECVDAVKRTAEKLSELGHIIEEFSYDFDYADMKRNFLVMLEVGSAPMMKIAESILGRKADTRDFSPVAIEILEQGVKRNGMEMDAAIAAMRRYGRIIATQSKKYDVVITPTLPELPQKLGHYDPLTLSAEEYHNRFFHGNNFVVPYNVSGQPAMSLPLHWSSSSLPVGVQIVAQWSREDILFRLAAQLEQAMPWRHRVAPYNADSIKG